MIIDPVIEVLNKAIKDGVKDVTDNKKLKIAVVAMKHELELKMAGLGKFYNRHECILYKALKEIGEL